MLQEILFALIYRAQYSARKMLAIHPAYRDQKSEKIGKNEDVGALIYADQRYSSQKTGIASQIIYGGSCGQPIDLNHYKRKTKLTQIRHQKEFHDFESKQLQYSQYPK